MPLTNPNKVVTEERLNEYHRTILPYLGGNSMVACGGGYAPIGTVISYMGTSAPSDFLICDGTVYNIADYTELADFFEAQFGSANFFGGDGNTTFAVPDLRGEFLRGTGTNSHANQGSGANVGVHQDGTGITRNIEESCNNRIENEDAIYVKGSMRYEISGSSPLASPPYYIFRPTNTSVLYCIKAKSQGNGYSLDEQIVGTWIDGKPIYQKTIAIPNQSTPNSMVTFDLTFLNIEQPLSIIQGVANYNNTKRNIPTIQVDNSWSISSNCGFEFTNEYIRFSSYNWASMFVDIRATIQYTKTTD